MKRVITLLLVTGVSFSTMAKPFKGGSWVGNGGDSLAMAIYSRVRELYKAMKSLSPECAATVPMTKGDFADLLIDLDITTSPVPLYLEENGRKVFKEAINYPEQVTIDFYREAYREAKNRDQLIMHEIMGLKGIPDSKGEVSEAFAATLVNNSCAIQSAEVPEQIIKPQAESAELEPGEIPVFSEIDRKGVIYFLVTGRNRVYRYSVPEAKYLPPLATSENPITLGVAPEGDRIYVAYTDRKITYFDPWKSLDEKPFVIAEITSDGFSNFEVDRFNNSQIKRLIVNGRTLGVIPSGRDASSFVFYAKNGQRVGQVYSISPALDLAPDSNGRGLYFISGNSPQNLAFIPMRTGGNTRWIEQRWPYHGQFYANGPVVASPLYVALGSGFIVSNGKMEMLNKLGQSFERAVWVGNQLFAGNTQNSGFSIRGFTAPKFEVTFERQQDMGALIGLHSFDKYLVVVWADATGNVKIEKFQ